MFRGKWFLKAFDQNKSKVSWSRLTLWGCKKKKFLFGKNWSSRKGFSHLWHIIRCLNQWSILSITILIFYIWMIRLSFFSLQDGWLERKVDSFKCKWNRCKVCLNINQKYTLVAQLLEKRTNFLTHVILLINLLFIFWNVRNFLINVLVKQKTREATRFKSLRLTYREINQATPKYQIDFSAN